METIKFTCDFVGTFGSLLVPFVRVSAEYIDRPSSKIQLSKFGLLDLKNDDTQLISADNVCKKVKEDTMILTDELFIFKDDVLNAIDNEHHQLETAVLTCILGTIQTEIPRLEKKKEEIDETKSELEALENYILTSMNNYIENPVKYYISIPTGMHSFGGCSWVGRDVVKFDCDNFTSSIKLSEKEVKDILIPDIVDEMVSEVLRVIKYFNNTEHSPILIYPNIKMNKCQRGSGLSPLVTGGEFVSMYALMRSGVANTIIVNAQMIADGTISTKVYTKHDQQYLNAVDQGYAAEALECYNELMKMISK